MQVLWASKNKILLVFAAISVLISGCVSTEEYTTLEKHCNEMMTEYTALQDEMEQLQSDNSAMAEETAAQEKRMQEIIDTLQGEIKEQSARIEMVENDLKVTLVEKLMFESGSAEVNEKGRELLKEIAPILVGADDQEIHVTGHCDQLPPNSRLREKYPSNWELSTARATAIIQILQWGYKIDPARLKAEGVAHYRPLVVEDETNRGTNRVVEITLTSKR